MVQRTFLPPSSSTGARVLRFIGEARYNVTTALTLFTVTVAARAERIAYDCSYDADARGCAERDTEVLTAGLDFHRWEDVFRISMIVAFCAVQLAAQTRAFYVALRRAPKCSDVGLCYQVNKAYCAKSFARLRLINLVWVLSVVVVSLALGIQSVVHLEAVVTSQIVSWVLSLLAVYRLHRPKETYLRVPYRAFRGIVRGADEHMLTWASLMLDAPTVLEDRWAKASADALGDRLCQIAEAKNANGGRGYNKEAVIKEMDEDDAASALTSAALPAVSLMVDLTLGPAMLPKATNAYVGETQKTAANAPPGAAPESAQSL